MPSTELIAPLNRAVYPAYAQLAKMPEKLMARFLEVYGLISLLSFPVAVGLFCLSNLVVSVLLGPQWGEAVPIMQILGLCGLVGALQGNMYIVMSAMGNPKANTLLSASILLVSLPLVVWSSLTFGALGAAYAYFCAALIGFFGIIMVFTRVTGVTRSMLAAVMWRPFLASCFMFLMLKLSQIAIEKSRLSSISMVQLPLLVLLGAIFYVALILVLWRLSGRPVSAEAVFLNLIKSRFPKVFLFFSFCR